MAAKRFQLVGIDMKDFQADSYNPSPFLQNFQTALLLSLLHRGFLTQQQFDSCLDELKRQKI